MTESYYGLRTAYTTTVGEDDLVISSDNVFALSWGLRPVVSISAKLLDISNASTDGSSASKAWNIK